MKSAWLMAAALVPAASFAVTSEMTDGKLELFVGGHDRTIFQCASSATGQCHNVLFDEHGHVMHRFAVRVGEKLSLVDVPSEATICVADARIDDTSTCKRHKIPPVRRF